MPLGQGVTIALPPVRGAAADALSALANLGYRRVEAQPAVERVVERLGEGASIDQVIRDSLKELAKA